MTTNEKRNELSGNKKFEAFPGSEISIENFQVELELIKERNRVFITKISFFSLSFALIIGGDISIHNQSIKPIATVLSIVSPFFSKVFNHYFNGKGTG